MKISIVIPAYNEEQYLPELFSCLDRQTYRDFEVIVSDAGSTDGTVEVARTRGARVVEGGLPGVGRNRGALHAEGEFLFFFDADIQIPHDFLENAVRELDTRSIELATCEAEPLSDLKIDKIMHMFANIFVKLYKDSNPRVPGYCILIKKSLFEKIGGFNEELKVAEDHDLVKRATQFTPLKVLRSTYIQVSVRRFAKEGRLPYIGKSLQIALYRSFKGEITDNEDIEYNFGDFTIEDDKVLQKTLIKMEKKINHLDQKVTRYIRKNKKKSAAKLENNFKELTESFNQLLSSMGKQNE